VELLGLVGLVVVELLVLVGLLVVTVVRDVAVVGWGADSLAAARVACWAATQKRPMSSLVRFFRAATVAGPPS